MLSVNLGVKRTRLTAGNDTTFKLKFLFLPVTKHMTRSLKAIYPICVHLQCIAIPYQTIQIMYKGLSKLANLEDLTAYVLYPIMTDSMCTVRFILPNLAELTASGNMK